jgi:hypothetical protein
VAPDGPAALTVRPDIRRSGRQTIHCATGHAFRLRGIAQAATLAGTPPAGAASTEMPMPNEKVAFATLHLAPGPNMEFVARFQRELAAALDNYVTHKKQGRLAAQDTLLTQQSAAMTDIKRQTDALSKQLKTEAKNKPTGWYKTEFAAQAPTIRHAVADPVVQGFEVKYQATRTDKKEVIERVENVAKFHGYPDHVGCLKHNGNPDHWRVVVFNGQTWVPVIELWFGSARFIATDSPGVFQHRTVPDRQYVQDRHGFFIARYLIRQMNKFDRANVEAQAPPDPTLTAAENKVPGDDTLDQEIMKHVRAKEASGGGTCFISFSHTKHAIVGSTAKLFYDQAKGDVIIDAAKVDQKARVDLHSLDAVKKLFGVDEVKPTMPFQEGDDSYERNAAARDTVRTREILIAGAVPKAAVVAVRLSTAQAKASWTTLAKTPAVLPKGLPRAWTD